MFSGKAANSLNNSYSLKLKEQNLNFEIEINPGDKS